MDYNILVVDDFGLTAKEIDPLLTEQGIKITEVHSTGDALKAISQNSPAPNAVIWVLNTTAAKELEELYKLKRITNAPIIVISKFTDKKCIIKTVEAGAAEYIVKPFEESHFVEKVLSLVGKPFDKNAGQAASEDLAVYNFSEMLDREIKAASRGGHMLAILKLVCAPKEEYGRRETVEMFAELTARIVKTRLRDTDSAFRRSYDTILILLPYTGREGAESVKQKIRDILKAHTLMKEKYEKYEIRISAAVYPEDGKIRKILMDKLELDEELHRGP